MSNISSTQLRIDLWIHEGRFFARTEPIIFMASSATLRGALTNLFRLLESEIAGTKEPQLRAQFNWE